MPLDDTISSTAIVQIPIADIVFRSALYPRSTHCPLTVERYSELTTIAPAICVNQHRELVDGRHRMLANLERGETTISAQIVQTRDDAHALDLSVQMNFDHGLPLSTDDRQRLAKNRYDPKLGKLNDQKQEIAEWLRVDITTVYRWLRNDDHRRRELRHERIRELAAKHWSQNKISREIGCSVALVNHVVHSLSSTSQKTNTPDGFEAQTYDVWHLTSNNEGIQHFGRTDPRILDNLIWRYARHPNDAVLDLFSGGGVTIDACARWNRKCLAYDRKPRPARGGDIVKHDVVTDGLLPPISDRDWRNVSLTFLDPPYSSQASGRYSGDASDLAHVSADKFEATLSNLVNALGDKLSSGSAICLLIRATQWHSGPDHRIRDHGFRIRCNVNIPFEKEVLVPLGKNSTPTELRWSQLEREWLVISRKILVWRV